MQSRKLKILQAVYCLGRGGAERLAIDITKQLAMRADVEVLLISFDKTVSHEYSTEGVNYKFCPSRINLSITGPNQISIDNFVSVLKEFKPDIIHSHRYLTEVICREYLMKGVKYFTHCHDNMVQFENLTLKTFFNKSLLTNFFEKHRLLPKYTTCNNQFIAISKDTEEYFKEVLPPELAAKVHLLPNAIDFSSYNKCYSKRDLNHLKLLNIGNFWPKKNQTFLVDVLSVLKRKQVNVHLTFLGDGPELQNVKDKAVRCGVSDLIHFAGNVNSVNNFLKDANVYVHSAYYEPFGLVLLEAMAAGLPVVSLDGRGNRGLIKNGCNGFFVEEQSAEMFAENILALAENEKKYAQMSLNAVEFAQKYDIVNYVDQLLEIYQTAS